MGPSARTWSGWPATASSCSAGGQTKRSAICIAPSTATILPGEEDFGIVPVEAQACGRPVVALGRGGALDTVIDGETGVLFADTTVDSLAAALTRAAGIHWDAARIRRHAEGFSRSRFVTEIAARRE